MTKSSGHSLDVAVIGAGITGLAVALNLAWQNAGTIRVFDREGIGAGASGVQPGGVRRQWGTRLNCLLSDESFAFFASLGDHLAVEQAPILERCGYVFVAHTESTLERMRRDVELQRSLGIPSEIISPAALAGVVPGIEVDGAVGAAFCGDDAYFDRPQAVVELFAQAAASRGVSVERRRVEGLRADGSGWRIEFGDRSTALAATVVIAAGLQTPELVGPFGVALPIEGQPKFLFLSDPIQERLLEPLVVLVDQHFAAKHLANGRVLASDLAAMGTVDEDAPAWRAHIRRCIETTLPLLTYVPFSVIAEGSYDMTPDHQPIVCEIGERTGLWVAAGFSGHGFMMAPAIGRMVAEAIVEHRIDPLLEQLHLNRFERGDATAELAVV